MADRSLIVRLVGDASSLKNTYNEAIRATKAFGNVQEQETRREEQNLLRLKTKRAQSLGPFRIAAAGLTGGAAVFAGIQGLRALADGLKVAGDEAFTTTGRIKNLGAALASGDIVGGFIALAAQESRIAPDLEKAVKLLQQMRDEASRVSLKDVVDDSGKFHTSLDQATKDMVTIGIPIDDATAKTAAWRKELQAAAATTITLGDTVRTAFADIGQLLDNVTKKAIAARKEGLAGLAQLPPGITAAISREQGPEGNQEQLLKTLQQADANLVRRIEEMRTQGKGRDVSEGLAKLQAERNSIDSQITGIFKARADAIEKQRREAEEAARKAKAAAEAAVRAQREAFEAQFGFLELRLDRAKLTSGLKDDLKLLDAEEKAVRAQIKVEGRTVELERQLFAIEQERTNIANERRRRIASQRQSDQFRALGLTAEGDKPPPTIANLQKQLESITARVAGTDLDTPNTKGLLERIRKVLMDPLSKATVETRAKVKELFDTLRKGFEEGTGPLTKTSGLNTKKVLEGLGLDAATENELRGRLSSFNSAGRALAPRGATATTGVLAGAGAGTIQVNSTIVLDGAAVGLAVTRHQQKTRRRNPLQKRGPNRIGGV